MKRLLALLPGVTRLSVVFRYMPKYRFATHGTVKVYYV